MSIYQSPETVLALRMLANSRDYQSFIMKLLSNFSFFANLALAVSVPLVRTIQHQTGLCRRQPQRLDCNPLQEENLGYFS